MYNERVVSMKKINTTKNIPKEWTRFQRNLIPPPNCEGCENHCTVLYDDHHDQYFSLNCGKIILEQGQYKIPYKINYTYNTTKKKNKGSEQKNDNSNSIKRQKK